MGTLLIRGALAALILLAPAPARPAESYCVPTNLPEQIGDRAFTRPMTFTVARVEGKSVLQAVGEIRPNEADRLAAALRAGPRVDELWLHSPGGSAIEGTRMGRVIRKAGLLVRLKRGQACISACSMAFLGGLIRVVEPGSFYGLHMMTTTRNTDLMVGLMDEMAQLSRLRKSALRHHLDKDEVNSMMTDAAGRYIRMLEQITATLAAEQARYLVEMSISVDLMTEEFAQSAQGVCYLGEAGLRRFNVANSGIVPPPAPVAPLVEAAPEAIPVRAPATPAPPPSPPAAPAPAGEIHPR